ncbi:ABC transporter ATP-binding protein [Williamsia sp. CHRR-6]|uniref:ABC transporter ATP-binding protein n=1 Tax=Williamsia sp. CHRR-6 TaxID=2835871 RepID=UPI001BD9CFF0|nr:ABC transporter ATP-binding protein [Williamsia sp. CHRR-6]MBT0567449.1 ABC transporter ATP-binding protein [Williamsia sp. CHRR-6]
MTTLAAADVLVRPGERIGLVGESGSGKSTLLRLLLALDAPTSGALTLDGRPVLAGSAASVRWFRRRVAFVPQDPATTLDPRRTVEHSVMAPLRYLRLAGDHRQLMRESLQIMGLRPDLADRRPAELSGGQRQRVVIARALACRPDYLLADEPVSGLDLTVREQVLDAFADLPKTTALLMVSHDLSVVAHTCDRLLVMHRGRIVESGPTAAVIAAPHHPHTRELIDAVPLLPAASPSPRITTSKGTPCIQ